MNENKNVCQVCGAGNGDRCGNCGMRNNYLGIHILRWILGIIIITWVFSIGMQFGRMEASFENSQYGYGGNFMFRTLPAAGWSQSTLTPAGNVMFGAAGGPSTMTGVQGGTVQVFKGTN